MKNLADTVTGNSASCSFLVCVV